MEEKKTNGVGIAALVVAIIGLVIGFVSTCFGGWGFLLCLISLILAIIALCKKNAKKGQAIAGLIISIVGILAGIIVMSLLAATMAPQLIKYTEKSQTSADIQFCDTVRSAIQTCIFDPDVIDKDQSTIEYLSDGYEHRISEIPASSPMGKAMEEILGIKLSEVDGMLKNSNAIYFTIDGYSVDVYCR